MIVGEDSCGLKYAVKRSGSAVAYCALSIKCGSSDEGSFKSGTAHFVEHCLFKGTRKKSATAINNCLEKLGGELNAFTTKEEIVLHATVLKEDLPKAVDLLMEIATSSIFPEKETEMEKGVVIEEINSYKDSPADDIYDKFEEMLFDGCPLGNPILGTASSVRKIRSKDLTEFVSGHFLPEKMALSVVADIDETRLERLCSRFAGKYFSGHKAETNNTDEARIPQPVPFDRTVDKHNHEVNAVYGNTAPSLYDTESRIGMILLCNILGGPASNSLLNSSLREKHGWVYGVECSYTPYKDSGIVAISLGCEKENLQQCEKEISRIIGRLQQKPLSASGLKSAKKQLIGQLAISSDNGESQCLSMGKSLLAFGKVSSTKENIEAIEAVTAEDIQTLAREIFAPEKMSRLIYL